MELFDIINKPEYTNTINAFSSLIVALATIIYAFLTYRILHSQNKTFIRPISIETTSDNNSFWKILINNFGPSIAVNIKIKVIAIVSWRWDRNINEYVNITRRITSTGPFELRVDSTGEYLFNGFIDYNYPIIIKWETVQGKKCKSKWIINTENNNSITQLSFLKGLILLISWLYLIIKTPYVKFRIFLKSN